MSEPSIIPALLAQIAHLQRVAQAAERAVTRLTHPTVDPEMVPGEVIAATVHDLTQALAGLGEGELEGVPAAGAVWEDRSGRVHGFVHETGANDES